MNHAEPPKHTVPPSPPRRVRSDRSPSPPPKRQRREDSGTDHRRSRDDYRADHGSRHEPYDHRDKGRSAAAPYGDRAVRSSRDDDRAPVGAHYSDKERARNPDRVRDADRARDSERPRDADKAPYGDRDRPKASDRDVYGDRGYHRSQRGDRHTGEESCSNRHRDTSKRSPVDR